MMAMEYPHITGDRAAAPALPKPARQKLERAAHCPGARLGVRPVDELAKAMQINLDEAPSALLLYASLLWGT